MTEIALPDWTPELTPELREATAAVIQGDRAQGNVAALRAAGAVGSKGHLRKLIEADDEMPRLIAEARGYDEESIEAEIVRRAIDGVDEPWHVTKDGDVKVRRVFSDRLLLALAKARHPAYRDTSRVEIAGVDNSPVRVVHERGLTLTDVLALRESLDGSVAGARGELPAARPVLPESPDG